MRAAKIHLNWLCRNIEENLNRVDAALVEILDDTAGQQAVEVAEPWVDRLFERRRGLQSTLAEIERQIHRPIERNLAGAANDRRWYPGWRRSRSTSSEV